MCCDLEIDVNGQETFIVDKNVFASFSGRLSKLFRKMTGSLKVIFLDFPGGGGGFELIAKFCYNGGKIDITPSNIFLLHYAAIYMEMNEDKNGALSLIDQTRENFKGIHNLAWSELLGCLKQCQELLPVMRSSYMLQEFLDCLVGRLSWPCFSSSHTSSSDSSCIQFSNDLGTESTSSYGCQTTNWWFGDLGLLNIDLLEKVVETMISLKLDNYAISSFLFHYKNSKFLGAMPAEKSKITETIVNLLYLLDRSFISIRGLFDILRCSLALKLKRCCLKKLESLIASVLDQATMDDLLFPSPCGKRYAYDVNLIMRLQKQFISKANEHFLTYQVKKVAPLIDSYMAEVAPDPHLKPSKFVALVSVLPDFARDSHDRIYEAMDLYFKVHKNLSEEEKIKLYCVLDYDKLSATSLNDLARNLDFPACATVCAAVSQHSKLKSSQRE